MPCVDQNTSYNLGDGHNYGSREDETKTATICGLFSLFEKLDITQKILNDLDYNQMGISRKQVEELWGRHKEKDRESK